MNIKRNSVAMALIIGTLLGGVGTVTASHSHTRTPTTLHTVTGTSSPQTLITTDHTTKSGQSSTTVTGEETTQ